MRTRPVGPAPCSGSSGTAAGAAQHSTNRIAIRSAIWIAVRALLHNVRFVDVLLVGSLLPPLVAGYWFVDALVQVLLLLALLFTLPALRHLESRHPFGFAATVLSLALVVGSSRARTAGGSRSTSTAPRWCCGCSCSAG